MSTRDLIDAIASGDSVAIQKSFETEMAGRIAERLDTMRQEVAKNMFKEAVMQGEDESEDDLRIENFSLEDLEEFMMSEEFEQLDELSKSTLSSYVKKAAPVATHRAYDMAMDSSDLGKKNLSKKTTKMLKGMYQNNKDARDKRLSNIGKAVDRLAKEEVELEEADAKVHPNALHVNPVGGGKYRVHAVGKNFADGIKSGEHLSDTELDDFREMGGKIKHVK